jgi:hypothetical protein
MKYGDFSSLVQLGVGVHLGTALLQLYGEIGVQPLVRTLARVKMLVAEQSEDAAAEEFSQLEADFDIFRIQLFNEFKKYIFVNSVAAGLLAVVLIVISYTAETEISESLSVFFVALSVLPAPFTLGILWFDASRQLRPLKVRADKLEQRCLRRGV